MPSFELYQKMLGGVTNGQARKRDSDMVMNATFWEDIGSRVAYIYDYYHDDEPLQYYPVHPENSKTKTPIDIKYLVNSYNSENKDQVGYHIQFRPGQKNPLDYYTDVFEKKYQAEFPIGLYIDIPDEQGVYRKWLITEGANWLNPQFPSWYVLPIDHVFQWVYNRTKYQMCGVGRSQNSYNQGTWVDQKIETVENQRKCILPMNDISATIFYDQRIVLSAPIEQPVVWRCTKIEQMSPKGISRLTFAQTLWNDHTDYIEKDEDGMVIGMWASYYDVNENDPVDPEPKPDMSIYSEVAYSGNSVKITIKGNFKKFTVTFYNSDGEIALRPGTWFYEINGVDVTDMLEIKTSDDDTSLSPNQIKVKFIGDDSHIGDNLVIGYESDDHIKSSVTMNLVGL